MFCYTVEVQLGNAVYKMDTSGEFDGSKIFIIPQLFMSRPGFIKSIKWYSPYSRTLQFSVWKPVNIETHMYLLIRKVKS